MFTLMITGFNSQEEINDFIEWYIADVTTLEKRIDGEATVIDVNQIERFSPE